MIFNGIEKDYLIVLRGRQRPAWAPVNRHLVTATGMAGAYLSYTETQVRVISVPVFLMAENIGNLQKVKEDLAEWLIHDEPKPLIFKDEPDRTYFAVVDGSLDLDELVRWGEGVITFICPDPYKYGPEKVYQTDQDTFIIENKGTAPTKPIFELTAKEPVTFAMVSDGERYNMIGRPANVDEQIVDEKVRVLYERGDTINEWTSAGTQVDGTVTGQMTTDGTGIVVQSYGTNEGWHGPALLKEIDPIQDFEVAMRLRVEAPDPKTTYRIEFYLFDEFMNVLGKMAIVNASRVKIRYAAEARVGPLVGSYVNYLIDSRNYQRDMAHFHGMLRMKRIGKRFEFYVARIGHTSEEGHIHHDTLTQVFNDVNNQYQGRLKYVQIHIGKYGDTPSAQTPRINAIEVFEHNEVLVDETPYIVYPGDTIEFDHVTKDIRLNGESRKDLKAFGGSFFTLKKGINTLTIMPENVFDTKITYRERYK